MDNYLKVLDREHIKRRMIQTSLFLSIFCAFESVVIDNLNHFFKKPEYMEDYLLERIPPDEKKKLIDEGFRIKIKNYKEEAKTYGFHSELGQYLLYWKNFENTLSDLDLIRIKELNEIRNKIAHNLFSFLLEPMQSVKFQDIIDLFNLTRKIEHQFKYHFDIACDSDFDNQNINKEEIESGNSLLNQYYIKILTDFFED